MKKAIQILLLDDIGYPHYIDFNITDELYLITRESNGELTFEPLPIVLKEHISEYLTEHNANLCIVINNDNKDIWQHYSKYFKTLIVNIESEKQKAKTRN